MFQMSDEQELLFRHSYYDTYENVGSEEDLLSFDKFRTIVTDCLRDAETVGVNGFRQDRSTGFLYKVCRCFFIWMLGYSE